MGRWQTLGGVARHAWLLQSLGLCPVHAGGSSRGDAASTADEVMLIQASTLRHQEPPASAALLDTDGCPVSDPRLAFGGNCSSGLVQAAQERSCTAAEDDEKEVYFMRHAEPNCCVDCGLNGNGVAQCRGMKAHNKLLRNGPLSNDSKVQIVYMSPATRAMETALLIYNDTGAIFRIDPLLVESLPFTHNRLEGERVINKMHRPELLKAYHRLFNEDVEKPNDWFFDEPWKEWHGDPEGRAANFTSNLLKSKEKYIAVVSHFHMLGSWEPTRLSMGCMEMGQVVVRGALSRNGTWRRISESPCQGRRRRWDWGNYKRQAQADLEDGI